MATFHTSLSATAQTAYAQLLDATEAAELTRSVASLNGSFASKQVKGRTYWYFQYTDISGRLRQIYVGPDSDRVRALIAKRAGGFAGSALEPLARAAEALGCEPTPILHFRVIRRLTEYGFFKAGGVLIGTHAFLTYGNMLGVRWGDTARTQDVDFAHAGKQLSLVLPSDVEVDTHAAIESLQLGLLPVADIAGKTGGTYVNPRDPDFQIDFLTPLHREGAEPYEHPQLKVTLQPLRFLEYILEDVQQGAMFCTEGAVVVNLPHPARYALHKLIVFGERGATRAVKATKDLRQAAALLSCYRDGAAWLVAEAWSDLVARGPGWRSRARRGRDAVSRLLPDLDLAKWLPLTGRSSKKPARGPQA